MGLNCFDVVSCTGDGGGENEGHQGIHAHFENLTPGYVRRRCIPHIAWRTCDQAIKASGLDLKALAAYLSDGATWSRLKDIATTGPAQGGLQLFSDTSQACKDPFGKSPICISVFPNASERMNEAIALQSKHNLSRRATEMLFFDPFIIFQMEKLTPGSFAIRTITLSDDQVTF